MHSNGYLKRMRKCPRIVRRNKYERLTQNNQLWWNNKFKELEAEVRIPHHKKYSELKKLFSGTELDNLANAGLEFENDEIENKSQRMGRERRLPSYRSTVFIPLRRSSLHFKSEVFIDRLGFFFKKPHEDARVWKPKPKLVADTSIPLKERAAIIEETLAEDFDNWFKNIKTYSPSEISKETILNIFEIKTSLPIQTAVVVNMQSMGTVPESVAKFLGNPELSSVTAMKCHLDSDHKAAKVKPLNQAFSKMLPPDLRRIRHTTDTNKTWFKVDTEHKELETFAAVFKDIMDLETSKRFVIWLRNHPDVKPPAYLQKYYMISRKKQPKKSFFIREIYEAKVWTVDNDSKSNSSERATKYSMLSKSKSSVNSMEDSYSEINFIV